MLSALFSEADLRFIFANGYKVAGSARGPLQSYPNESNAEEVGGGWGGEEKWTVIA